jgi:NAD(P)-dependent dehydrogenase (short-subunit alcohol dehydrogenase family)
LTIKLASEKFKIDNKTIVVTGGAGLIGTKVVKGLSEAGARVIIAEIAEKKSKDLEMYCRKENLNVFFKKLDITNKISVDSFLQNYIDEFKILDAWVNTAYPKSEDWGIENISNYDSFIENVNTHLGGYYLTTTKVAELMKKQGFGSIVNFSSIYGVTAPDFSIYSGTDMKMPIPYSIIKSGINMLTKYIASYYGKYNIRANVIAAGGVFNNQPEQFVKNYEEKVPLGRMATPDDIIGPVIFLVSDASAYITGQIIMVDGGWTIW